VQRFNCVQEGAAKYATGIFDKGERWALEPNSEERVLEQFLSADNFPGLFSGPYHLFPQG
jgi:hypothetical protein